MGWSFCPSHTQKSQVVAERTQPYEGERHRSRTLKHCCVGNVLWTVRENQDKQTGKTERYIGCDLLQNGGIGHGWGYKDLCESMFPFYYHCPLAYLALAPEANATWRKRVHAWHAQHNEKLTLGQVVRLKNCNVKMPLTVTSLVPLRGRDPYGNLYKIPRKFIQSNLPDPESILTPEDEARQALLAAGKALRCSASTCNDAGDMVHVLFQKQDRSHIGYYMHKDTYHAIPYSTDATPEDYQKHGQLMPAPSSYGNDRVTKEVTFAEFFAHHPIPQLAQAA